MLIIFENLKNHLTVEPNKDKIEKVRKKYIKKKTEHIYLIRTLKI